MILNIVTVNYNNDVGLIKTLENIAKLKKKFNFKYIIIDGGSTDNSVKLISEHSSIIDDYISESDTGIYNAMNKSLNYITNGYVVFMNSGDIFEVNNFRLLYNDIISNKYDLIYGDYIIESNNRQKLKSNGNCDDLWKGMFCHQSLAVRYEFLNSFPFDEKLKICADTNFILNVLKEGVIIKKINHPLAIIEPGGLSDVNRLTSIKEQWRLSLKYRIKSVYEINQYFIALYFKNLILTVFRRIRGIF
ncbi:TPA: glycosyltransferase [Photobacterium damselae]